MNQLADDIVEAVIKEMTKRLMVEVEASGRHAHLCRADVELLFGTGYQLTKVRELSQPGQFVCAERISLTGPKGTLHNVVVLGPERNETQAEISMTDGMLLGIRAPVRLSGDLEGSPGAVFANGDRKVSKNKGLIVAQRHLHLAPEDAARFQINDGDAVKIKVNGSRPVVFEDTIARISDKFATYVHIDYDEANACGFSKGTFCRIIR